MKPILLLTIFLSWILASAQVRIDATVPTNNLRRPPTTMGRGGGVGRRLSLQISITSQNPTNEEISTIRFSIKNIGKEPLTIPVCPNAADVEPSNDQVSYSITVLALRLNSSQAQKIEVLPGGASLYGNPSFPKSLLQLKPGESVEVDARLSLGPASKTGGVLFVGYVGLNHEDIETEDGKTSSNMQEIGYALSPPYTAEALFHSQAGGTDKPLR